MNENLSDLQKKHIDEWDGNDILLICPRGSVGIQTFEHNSKQRHDATEYWCAMQKLDELGVPRIDTINKGNREFSIVGRIMWLAIK